MGSRRSARRPHLTAILFTLALLATGCEAMVPYHWHSAETDNERVALVIEAAPPETPPLQVVLPTDGAHPSLRVSPLVFQTRFEELLAHNVITAPRSPWMWSGRTAGEFFAEPPRPVDGGARGRHGALFEVRPGVRGLRLER